MSCTCTCNLKFGERSIVILMPNFTFQVKISFCFSNNPSNIVHPMSIDFDVDGFMHDIIPLAYLNILPTLVQSSVDTLT